MSQNQFDITQQTTYEFNSVGIAKVSQEISLKNKYPEIFAKEYQINLNQINPENITAYDSLGNILNQVASSDNTTNIKLKFNQEVVGQDQINRFNLNYTSKTLGKIKGNTLEINLPRQNFEIISQNQIVVIIPSSFGELSFASTKNYRLDRFTNYHQLTLTNPTDQTLVFVFGNHQLFDFKLIYQLENTTKDLVRTEIALPPDTDQQTLFYSQIEPPPQNVSTDLDGNWLAQYQLNPQSAITITATGQAKILTKATIEKNSSSPSYLQEQPFWPINDSTIQNIAQTLTTPKSIYQYVVNTLSYDYNLSNPGRQGALQAIANPDKALCTEFTDLFITLARAKKIPAREIEGFALTENTKIKPVSQESDILHAWPEFFRSDQQRWQEIDPTWGKTTNGVNYFDDLDLNHFAFVIHGLDSRYPSPAGTYKNHQQIQTVFVNYATKETSIAIVPPKLKAEKFSLLVTNPNGSALRDIKISQKNWEKSLDVLPPFSHQKINLPSINFFQSLLPSNRQLQYVINSNTSSSVQSVIYYPHYLNLGIMAAIIILILSLIGFFLTKKHEKNH